MKAFNDIGEASQNPEFKENSGKITFSQEIQDKYDKLFGDDKMENTEGSEEDLVQELTPEEREEKLNMLFDAGDFFDKPEESSADGNIAEGDTGEQMESDMSEDTHGSEQKDTNSSDELDGDVYETDDNGETYKRNGELLPNIEYTVNGNTYRTDENGRIISCVSKPTYTDIEHFSEETEGETSESNEENEKREGLTDEEKAEIKKETGWSDEIINAIESMEEYEVYKEAGLVETEINGKKCLIRNDIDWDQKDAMGRTNRERAEQGLSPINKDGKVIELHHIGQHKDSPLAELTTEEHRGKGNDAILHNKDKESEIDRQEFARERSNHWQARTNEGGDQ